jgi:hypothetical protein
VLCEKRGQGTDIAKQTMVCSEHHQSRRIEEGGGGLKRGTLGRVGRWDGCGRDRCLNGRKDLSMREDCDQGSAGPTIAAGEW